MITYPPPRRVAKYCDDRVCLSVSVYVCVCLSASISLELHVRYSPIFVRVTYGRGSVLLCRRCDMLFSSAFIDDVIFAHNGPHALQ